MTEPNAFIGRAKAPSPRDLAVALGSARPLWDEVLETLAAELGLKTREWHSYSVKAGWALRIKKGDRNIVYLIPETGGFSVSVVLGDKAIAAARKTGLPAAVLDLIAGARKYAEGTGIRFEVGNSGDVAAVRALAAAKLAG
ncbi:MAG: DUF3788 domain-containing protein [Acidobacteriota bacterium]|nr:DUF3788 domain-containing protein [Acidobacteriota bacterium]